MKKTTKLKLLDAAERTVATFVETFLGLVLVTNLSDPKAVEAAGIASALAAGKYVYVELGKYLQQEGQT